jgi:phage/plasmid-like protein (TIGR03299 family)
MAHMIENNQIAYKNETPWHGLGFKVADNATGQEMLEVAGLNWKVQRRTLAMCDSKGQGLIVNPLAGYRAIVRSDTDHVFAVPTNKYNLVQNSEIVDLFREYCEAGHASMETVGALRGGSVVWALAKLNGGSSLTIKGNDVVNGYVLMTTSHDGSLSTTAKATQVRVVCHNTMTAALAAKADFRLKHSAKWTPERKDEAKQALGIAMEQVQTINTHSAKLAEVSIDQSDWVSFMTKLMGLDAVLSPITGELTKVAADIYDSTVNSPGADLVSAKGTLWGAVNGVTHYVDHKRGRSQDSRLSSAWFGDSDMLKRSAMVTALEMAGVAV